MITKFTNQDFTEISHNSFVPTSINDCVLQFCSIFSLFLQSCNVSLVLFSDKIYKVQSFKTLKFQTIDILPLVENGYNFNKN